MQADLRRTHRRIWPVLAMLLAVGFVLGLALRAEKPVMRGSVESASAPGAGKP